MERVIMRRYAALASTLLGLLVFLAVFASLRSAPASRIEGSLPTRPAVTNAAVTRPTARVNETAQNGTPVVVELFTSEGCSSCPPADALLSQLVSKQPVPGAHIIALGQHVDYWNNLGWTDPFSSAGFSQRQGSYSRILGGGAYTPEMVVDGTTGFVGSDSERAYAAIEAAAHTPKAAVDLMFEKGPPGGPAASVRLGIHITHLSAVKGSERADVLLAITEDGLHSAVARGENAGRTLHHAAVVRDFRFLGNASGDSYNATSVIPLKSSWIRSNLQAVVVVQGETTHRMLGAASLKL